MRDSGDMTIDLLACARRLKMFASGSTVLAAVSGGADSVAMLHALLFYSREMHFTLHACHVNHMIRETAERDQIFVENLCGSLGIACTVCMVDIPGLVADGGGIEETARNARYELLEQTADKINAFVIAVAHTADDVAETLLHNLVRGTGIEGLASIKPIRGRIVRPILDSYRADVEAYLAIHKLDHVEDETNTDTAYTRNRIRHELIPYLKSNYNPSVVQALKRLADIAGNTYSFVSSHSRAEAARIAVGDQFSVALFRQLDPAVRYEIIRQQIVQAKGDPQDITYEQVRRVVDALDTDDDFSSTLPDGIMEVYRRGEAFTFRTVAPPEHEPYCLELSVPGTVAIPGSGNVISASVVPKPSSLKVTPDTALLDLSAISGKLSVRNPRPGDRIVPFGMSGTKKLQDVFVDNHIPARERGNWPIIVDSEKILWVTGLVASNVCAVRKDAEQVVKLTISQRQG